ncbi:hypothetical protein EJ110_NYTH13016 [Nymphaea thermarum]|nr:hypothetical protein EJ110_NYTH13016 [Nymphaea thermarum]
MRTKYFLVYLLSGSLVVISYAFFSTITTANKTSAVLGVNEFLQSTENQQIDGFSSTHSETTRVWPKLKFSWRVVVVTVIGFLGSALGTVVGVSGGGIFVPMFNLILGFDAKSSAALSKCMIMGASASSVWYNLTVPHPCRDVPILDYDLALLFQPMLMLGITIGVALSVVFPYWLITILIIILFTSKLHCCISFYGLNKKKDEEWYFLKGFLQSNTDVESGNDYEGNNMLQHKVERATRSDGCLDFNNLRECSPLYWALYILQFPLALSVFIYEAVKLWKEDRQRRTCGNEEPVCEASIEWTPFQLIFCAFCATLGGTVGGLLGSGAGFIMGPLLLELGVIPQVFPS